MIVRLPEDRKPDPTKHNMCPHVVEFVSVRVNEQTKAHRQEDSGWKTEFKKSFSQRKIKQPIADLADRSTWR